MMQGPERLVPLLLLLLSPLLLGVSIAQRTSRYVSKLPNYKYNNNLQLLRTHSSSNNNLILDPCSGLRSLAAAGNYYSGGSSLVICVPDVVDIKNNVHQVGTATTTTTVRPIYENDDDEERGGGDRQDESSTARFYGNSIPLLLPQPSSYAAARQEIPNREAEYTVYPKYSYNYGVQSISSGDMKAAWEERDGDTVRGEYTVVDPDGVVRTVSYTANDKDGFKAVITKKKSRKAEMITRIADESAMVPILLGRHTSRSSRRFKYRHPQHRYDYV